MPDLIRKIRKKMGFQKFPEGHGVLSVTDRERQAVPDNGPDIGKCTFPFLFFVSFWDTENACVSSRSKVS